MKDFSPYVATESLAILGKARQVYPLDAPYGRKDKRQPDNPLSYWQIKARPSDPASPFIWGHYALMMVCGGYFTPKQAPTGYPGGRKPYTVKVNGYEGPEVYREPDPGFSDAHTTNKLLAAMLNAGFTWEEACSTLERYPAAGGSYWAWVHKFEDEDRRSLMLREWRETKRNENLTPVSVSSSWNPWSGYFSNSSLLDIEPPLLDIPGVSSKGGSPTYIHNGTQESMEIVRDRASEILKAMKSEATQVMRTPYETGPQDSPVRVSTALTLKRNPIIKLRGRTESFLRDLYLPYLVESGLVLEHTRTQLRKSDPKRSGPLPDKGYTLSPLVDDPEAMQAFWGQWPTWVPPKPQESAQSPVEPQTEPAEPLAVEDLLQLVGSHG